MEKAVGTWPWRRAVVRASSAQPISREMTLLLALVIFDGYELFPGKGNEQSSAPPKM